MYLLFFVLVLILLFLYCGVLKSESYGQDASIRAGAGWVAGPMYGYDPIAQYAEQIQESQDDLHEHAKKIGCAEICEHGNVYECTECFNNPPKETLVIGIMPLPDHELDNGQYVPEDIEYQERFGKSSCMACQ